MFDMEERELSKLNQSMKDIPKPDNINEYVKKGVALGIKKKRRSRIKMFSNIAAALILAMFITSVRAIPAFAQYVTTIPGLEYIVNLINYDKGLQSAVENNFIEHINSSVTHEGLTVTIKDVILDSSKGIIFYSIENKGSHRFVNLENMNFMNEKGEHLKAGVSWGGFINKDMAVEKKLDGMVEINFFNETVIPDKIFIEAKLRESTTANPEPGNPENVLSSVWKFELTVDKEKIKSMEKTYVLDQSTVVEGQKILFKKITISPTRIAVEVEYDKNNSKKIFRFDDLKLIDEKGETWATITNGVSGSIIDENHEMLYFQSNYFTDPKELYLTGSSIRAFDKDKCTVEIDVENSKLLKAPNDRLSLTGISRNGSNMTLDFNLRVDDPRDEHYSYNVISYYIKDASGKVYERGTAGSTSSINGVQHNDLTINKAENIKSPLYLNLEDYPERIKGDFKLKIK